MCKAAFSAAPGAKSGLRGYIRCKLHNVHVGLIRKQVESATTISRRPRLSPGYGSTMSHVLVLARLVMFWTQLAVARLQAKGTSAPLMDFRQISCLQPYVGVNELPGGRRVLTRCLHEAGGDAQLAVGARHRQGRDVAVHVGRGGVLLPGPRQQALTQPEPAATTSSAAARSKLRGAPWARHAWHARDYGTIPAQRERAATASSAMLVINCATLVAGRTSSVVNSCNCVLGGTHGRKGGGGARRETEGDERRGGGVSAALTSLPARSRRSCHCNPPPRTAAGATTGCDRSSTAQGRRRRHPIRPSHHTVLGWGQSRATRVLNTRQMHNEPCWLKSSTPEDLTHADSVMGGIPCSRRI